MKKFTVSVFHELILISLLLFQNVQPALTHTAIADYQNWGWDSAQVISNGIITSAILPQLGGRIMKLDLGDRGLFWINSNHFGSNTPAGSWINYGGFKSWPAPQHRWNWPPPVKLDGGKYSFSILNNSEDSIIVELLSPVEDINKGAAGLQIKRMITFYAGTSKIHLEQRLYNKSSEKTNWAVWDITQFIMNHPNTSDYTNFQAYFPRRSDLSPTEQNFFILYEEEPSDTPFNRLQIKSNYKDGIDAFVCNNKGIKIGINTDKGWIAYVDEQNGLAYVKTAPFDRNATYPDSGSVFQIYSTSSKETDPYIEIEALSPLKDIAVNDSGVFVECWYTTRTFGPILEVNKAGAIRKKLIITEKGVISGDYGVFYQGTVKVKNCSSHKEYASYPVTPLTSFILADEIVLSEETGTLALFLYDSKGMLVDTLDKTNFTTAARSYPKDISTIRVHHTPTHAYFHCTEKNFWSICMLDASGKCVTKRQFKGSGNIAIPLAPFKPGLYLYTVKSRTDGRELIRGKITVCNR